MGLPPLLSRSAQLRTHGRPPWPQSRIRKPRIQLARGLRTTSVPEGYPYVLRLLAPHLGMSFVFGTSMGPLAFGEGARVLDPRSCGHGSTVRNRPATVCPTEISYPPMAPGTHRRPGAPRGDQRMDGRRKCPKIYHSRVSYRTHQLYSFARVCLMSFVILHA